MEWIILVIGLTILLAGGDALVRGATSLAHSLGVSPMVVGMTVVAFGTSAPELGVNVAAALGGQTDITFGNVVGSNIANIGLILGVTALVRPLLIHRTIITVEIPMMLVATGAMIVLASDRLIRGTADVITAVDGTLLLLGFAAFLASTARRAMRDRESDVFIREAAEEEQSHKKVSRAMAALLTVLGLAGVLFGSQLTVNGATEVARSLGMSEALVGLTIVAVGTSLPELTASIFAALKGQADLSIGNVVGSNVFNVLLVLGVSSTIHPVDIAAMGRVDLLALAAFSLVLLPLVSRQKMLGRAEGVLLVVAYGGFMVWRTLVG